MTETEPAAEVVREGIDPTGRPYRLVSNVGPIDLADLLDDHEQYEQFLTWIGEIRADAEERGRTLIETPTSDPGRPPMTPIGYWWRSIRDDGWSPWHYVATRDEIPTDRSGIQVQSCWVENIPE
jgi:hypothetical protein